MSIEYVINYDCGPKLSQGGEQAFLELIKDAARAEGLLCVMEHEPDKEVTPDLVFTLDRIGPRGRHTQQKMTVREIIESGGRLEQYTDECRECPANVSRRTGGCFGSIDYPISAEAEEWLMSRLPEDLNGSIRGSLLKQFIRRFGRNAQAVDASRRVSSIYQAPRPVVRTWGKGVFGTTMCTSSMILSNLYLLGEIQPLHGVMMCFFLGAVDKAPTEQSFSDPVWVLNMNSLPEDESTQQIAAYLRALHTAYGLDVTTHVDAS